MIEYPYTIENGAGERLTFCQRVHEPDGDRVVGEALVAPGAGPPMHVHYLQDEAFTVVHGRIGYQIAGREPAFAGEGETPLGGHGNAGSRTPDDNEQADRREVHGRLQEKRP